MNHKANPNHFFKAIDHCIAAKFSKAQAQVMAKGYSRRGMVDAADGCMHYSMILIAMGCDK